MCDAELSSVELSSAHVLLPFPQPAYCGAGFQPSSKPFTTVIIVCPDGGEDLKCTERGKKNTTDGGRMTKPNHPFSIPAMLWL